MSNELNKLWGEVEHELGFNDHNMRRDRPYNGQPHTNTGIRGSTEIKGITFRDLRDCYIRAILLSTGAQKIGDKDMRPLYEEADKGENAALCENDLYGFDFDKLDPMAICQNLCCEVERVMGIFPNLHANQQATNDKE
jgi:hypothetical protein